MKKIIVLGGGTAGWLTAIYIRKIMPDAHINLIQSEDVGIVGVGEATTQPFIPFLNSLGIDFKDVLKKTNGTIKNGISFENWNGDNKKYFHSFGMDKIVDFKIPFIFDHNCFDFYIKNVINQKLNLEEYQYSSLLSYKNKVDVDKNNFALHFDASLMARYLQNVGIDRNITVVSGLVSRVLSDDNELITGLLLENGVEINCDFIFDCSGLSRLLIGKHYKTKWKSYSKHLPMKKAIPFWTDAEENIEPYTSAIAMKYGWLWKTPLQNRNGMGYVFDSDYIDEADAKKEVEEYLGINIDVRKIISFDAGRYEKFWVKNCIAVGLSSSFIEPLESSSIWLTIAQLFNFTHFINDIETLDPNSVDLFNELCAVNMDSVLNLVYLHYLTKRNDSKFWVEFKSKYPPPENFTRCIELIKEGNLRFHEFSMTNKVTTSFSLTSYIQIANGLNLIDNTINNNGYENVYPSVSMYKKYIDNLSNSAIDHRQFLNQVCGV